VRSTIIHGPGDIRLEERPEPTIVNPTDAIVRTVAACVCGSDLWRYRGIADVPQPTPIGHEYVGIVEAVGYEVSTVQPGQFVVGGFLTSDNTCPVCRAGAHANCQHVTGYDGCQAELIRVQNADGTLLATPGQPDPTWSPACWPCPTSCVPAGTPPCAPTSALAAPSSWSATGRSGSPVCSPPRSWAQRASSQ
jgi:threonine dehydrogenase-like Zn-dependent dehydrogenase